MLDAIQAPAMQTASAADEIEWLQLEATSDAVRAPVVEDGQETGAVAYVWRDWTRYATDCAPKYPDRPHPHSYGASLPMRASLDASGRPRIQPLTPAERRHLASREAKPVIRANAPHTASECAHLPLTGLRLVGGDPIRKWSLTVAEKHALAARPLRFARA